VTKALSPTLQREKKTKSLLSEFSEDKVVKLLYINYLNEVQLFSGKPIDKADKVIDCCHSIAKWFVKGNKNLILQGSVGVGKTTYLKAIRLLLSITNYRYDNVIVQAVNMQDIALISDDSFTLCKKCKILMIDDVGIEQVDVKKYGNIKSPFNEVIDARYFNNLSTIITTNLDNAALLEKYGERTSDRLREYAKITLKMPSFR
jgi:DNA replication protein DnaC